MIILCSCLHIHTCKRIGLLLKITCLLCFRSSRVCLKEGNMIIFNNLSRLTCCLEGWESDRGSGTCIFLTRYQRLFTELRYVDLNLRLILSQMIRMIQQNQQLCSNAQFMYHHYLARIDVLQFLISSTSVFCLANRYAFASCICNLYCCQSICSRMITDR